METIEEEKLKSSPVYNMSMCSLENFHTCFLHWLGNIYPDKTLKLFMPNDTNTSNEIIKFEKQIKLDNEHICDLYISKGQKNILVVENKLKSFPNNTQLNEYGKLLDKNTKRILLSLAPKIDLLPKEWEYLSYSKLATKMEEYFENEKDIDDYHKLLIKDYIMVIKTLSKNFLKSDSINDSSKYDFYDTDLYKNIEKIHIENIYIKYKSSELGQYIFNNTEYSQYTNIGTDFRNKQGIINIIYKDKIFDIEFRIQIQKYQYRYCIICNDDKRESIATSLAEQKLWFNNCKTNYPHAKNFSSKKFCGYGTDFIYRYQTLEKDITYKEIADKVKKDISSLINKKQEIYNNIKIFK